ncbi:MAG: hypothetical protein WBL20_09515 [Sphingobium sp.]|uniref:hypothetical protein n=1 Tax=Sphingobium sp. TaxID=1912891 RepID=UPI003BAF15A6
MTDASANPAPTPAPAPAPETSPATPPVAPDLLERAPQAPGSDPLPEWMGGLPDELKADATLRRFGSVEDLAKGHVEAHKIAKSKVMLPKEGDADSVGRFFAAIRPETPDAYQFNVPEGQDNSLADAMRPIFHQAGLHPESAKILVDGWNAHMAELDKVANQKGADELAALEAEMGRDGFAKGKQAAVNMLNRLGLPADFENDMARFIGGGNTLRMLFNMAERMGELGRVDPTDIKISTGQLTAGEAMDEARRMMRDPAIAPKLADPGSAERKRYDQLVGAASAKA